MIKDNGTFLSKKEEIKLRKTTKVFALGDFDQELIDEYGAVGTWWNEATKSNVTSFI